MMMGKNTHNRILESNNSSAIFLKLQVIYQLGVNVNAKEQTTYKTIDFDFLVLPVLPKAMRQKSYIEFRKT